MPIPASFSQCTAVFADRHIHGIAGVDFATGSIPAIHTALEFLATRRTTSVTSSLPTLGIDAIGPALQRLQTVAGTGALDAVHLEGPFLAPRYTGAHPPTLLQTPDSSMGRRFVDGVLQQHQATGLIAMMTLAPELSGADRLMTTLIQHGIQPALGHTNATYRQMRDAITQLTESTNRPAVITHVYNAMRGFHHRDPGPLLAITEAAARNEVLVELIANGHHVDFEVIRWWFDTHPYAIRLVSDASAATLPGTRAPLLPGTPTLGAVTLQYPAHSTGPQLVDGTTIASGNTDLLGIHDALGAAGFDHELVCAAMRDA